MRQVADKDYPMRGASRSREPARYGRRRASGRRVSASPAWGMSISISMAAICSSNTAVPIIMNAIINDGLPTGRSPRPAATPHCTPASQSVSSAYGNGIFWRLQPWNHSRLKLPFSCHFDECDPSAQLYLGLFLAMSLLLLLLLLRPRTLSSSSSLPQT